MEYGEIFEDIKTVAEFCYCPFVIGTSDGLSGKGCWATSKWRRGQVDHQNSHRSVSYSEVD